MIQLALLAAAFTAGAMQAAVVNAASLPLTTPRCTPPARPAVLIGMPGCLQGDGSLLTAKGFRIGLKRGAGGAVEVEIQPPDGGSGFQAAQIDRLLDEGADQLQAQADQADAGLERHALREAATRQRQFSLDVREAVQKAIDVEAPPRGRTAQPMPAPAASPLDLEAWCADMAGTAAWAAGHWAAQLASGRNRYPNLPPIPAPPAIDYFDCYGCDLDRQQQYEKDAQDWVEQQWFGGYLEPEMRTLRAVVEYAKKEYSSGPALAQAGQQPGSACATLAATGATLRGGFNARLYHVALWGLGDKGGKLRREYGRKDQYPSGRPVWLAYITQLKIEQLLTCDERDMTQETQFIQRQLIALRDEWNRRLLIGKDLGQLGNMATMIAFEKQQHLLAATDATESVVTMISFGVLDLKLKFQVKLAGQNAGSGGYVLAQVSGSTPVFAYIDPSDRKCGLLRSVEMDGDVPRQRQMSLRIDSAEMFGPGQRNAYRAPAQINSTVVIDLPCCRRNQAQDQAFVYVEALGAQAGRGERETWSLPGLAPFPVVDSWFRLAFNIGALMKMVDSGQADAQAAQLEQDMAVKVQAMDALQARYDRGEASLADLVAGANAMRESLTGAGSVGNNAFLSQAQHYRLEVPFQNLQATPIKVKLDARQLLQGGGEAAEGVLENLAYGFGDIELSLRNARRTGSARPKSPVRKSAPP